MDAYWAAPPVIRTITLATVITSAAVHGGFISAYRVIFHPILIFTLKRFPPEIWRLFTSFWLTGPQMGLIFDPYFLYTYGSMLETGSPRLTRKGDFMAYIIFVQAFILIVAGWFMGGMTFLPEGPSGGTSGTTALILALVYTRSQEAPTQRTTFFVITVEAKYTPFIMLALTFVMAGPGMAKQQAVGIVAAHAHDFLSRIWPQYGGGENWIEKLTPAALRRAFGEVEGARGGTARAYGTAFRGPGANQGGGQSSSGSTTGFANAVSGSGPSWSARGTGRRLGGD